MDDALLMHDLTLIGTLRGDPILTKGGVVYFRIDSGGNEAFPCFCNGKTAENMVRFLHNEDEVSIEGKLHMTKFRGDKQPTLLVFARHISYGRKQNSLVSAT